MMCNDKFEKNWKKIEKKFEKNLKKNLKKSNNLIKFSDFFKNLSNKFLNIFFKIIAFIMSHEIINHDIKLIDIMSMKKYIFNIKKFLRFHLKL